MTFFHLVDNYIIPCIQNYPFRQKNAYTCILQASRESIAIIAVGFKIFSSLYRFTFSVSEKSKKCIAVNKTTSFLSFYFTAAISSVENVVAFPFFLI